MSTITKRNSRPSLKIYLTKEHVKIINKLIYEGKYNHISAIVREALDDKLKKLGHNITKYNPNHSVFKLRRFTNNPLKIILQLRKKKYQTARAIHSSVNNQYQYQSIEMGHVRRILHRLKENNVIDYKLRIEAHPIIKYDRPIQHWYVI